MCDRMPNTLLPMLLLFRVTLASEFPLITNTCPAITDTQLAGCNTDCGRVEVKLGGSGPWRHVCSSNWRDEEARVVCRQLGFPRGGPIYTFHGKGEVGVSEVRCEGTEESLAQCSLQLGKEGQCGGVAGVYCTAVDEHKEEDGLEELQRQVLDQLDRRHRAAAAWVKEQGDRSCHILPSIHRPFTTALQEEAFIYPGQMASLWTQLSIRLDSTLCEPDLGPTIQQELAQLVDAGLEWGALGLRLPHSITRQQEELLAALYLAPSLHTAVTWELDVVRAPALPEIKHPGLDMLYRDGVFKTDDWNLPSSLISQLSSLASSLLKVKASSHSIPSFSASVSSTSNSTVTTARLPLSVLEANLANSSIPALVTGYLGPGARLSGYKITICSDAKKRSFPNCPKGLGSSSLIRLATTLEQQAQDNYIAGLWHHDRTGRRLKMFVFLHDVDCEEGHPTEIAVGSHRLVYFATHTLPVSRFRDSYVRSRWRTVRGCGERGGGFIFDTHAVHEGTPRGTQARTVLILEFHPKYKCGLASGLGLGFPCPSGDQYIVDSLM